MMALMMQDQLQQQELQRLRQLSSQLNLAPQQQHQHHQTQLSNQAAQAQIQQFQPQLDEGWQVPGLPLHEQLPSSSSSMFLYHQNQSQTNDGMVDNNDDNINAAVVGGFGNNGVGEQIPNSKNNHEILIGRGDTSNPLDDTNSSVMNSTNDDVNDDDDNNDIDSEQSRRRLGRFHPVDEVEGTDDDGII
jgi:hypothetical protein